MSILVFNFYARVNFRDFVELTNIVKIRPLDKFLILQYLTADFYDELLKLLSQLNHILSH